MPKRARLTYEIVTNNVKTKRDVINGITSATHLFTNEPGMTAWISISIPFKGSLIQHSVLMKPIDTVLMIADINGDDCYVTDGFNQFYKPLVDGIISSLGLDSDPIFLNTKRHKEAKAYATKKGPSDGGCSQYCEYLTDNHYF